MRPSARAGMRRLDEPSRTAGHGTINNRSPFDSPIEIMQTQNHGSQLLFMSGRAPLLPGFFAVRHYRVAPRLTPLTRSHSKNQRLKITNQSTADRLASETLFSIGTSIAISSHGVPPHKITDTPAQTLPGQNFIPLSNGLSNSRIAQCCGSSRSMSYKPDQRYSTDE